MHATERHSTSETQAAKLYVSLELAKESWKLTFAVEGQLHYRRRSITGGRFDLCGIGVESAWTFALELFGWRNFTNQRVTTAQTFQSQTRDDHLRWECCGTPRKKMKKKPGCQATTRLDTHWIIEGCVQPTARKAGAEVPGVPVGADAPSSHERDRQRLSRGTGCGSWLGSSPIPGGPWTSGLDCGDGVDSSSDRSPVR